MSIVLCNGGRGQPAWVTCLRDDACLLPAGCLERARVARARRHRDVGRCVPERAGETQQPRCSPFALRGQKRPPSSTCLMMETERRDWLRVGAGGRPRKLALCAPVAFDALLC